MTTEQQRKMLEAAAKACGYEYPHMLFGGRVWNPLTNPADTAEMCAELKIATTWGITYDFVDCSVGLLATSNETRSWLKDHDNSRLKAWMHAATMCAAKIGGYAE